MNPEQNFHEKCICQVCKCGKHKCPKPHPKGDFTTSYGKDYQTHAITQLRTPKKIEVYEPTHYDPKDLVSQYQGNYVQKSSSAHEPGPRVQKNFVLPESGFEGESSYNNSYKGFEGRYGDLRAKILRKLNTVEKNEFQGESTYNSNYMGVMAQKPEKVVMKDSIELAKESFEGITTYQKNYTEKSNAKPDLAERPRSRKDLINNNNSFTGGTSYTDSYIGSPGTKNPKFVPKGQLSVGNQQFEGQSNYTDHYKGIRPQLRMPILPNSGIPVIPSGSFQGNSTYISSYIGTRANKAESYRPKQTPLAQGAFNSVSTYSDHYIPTRYQPRVKNRVKQGTMSGYSVKRPYLQLVGPGAFEIQLKAEDVDLIICNKYHFKKLDRERLFRELLRLISSLVEQTKLFSLLFILSTQTGFLLKSFSVVEDLSWLSINFLRVDCSEESRSQELVCWSASSYSISC